MQVAVSHPDPGEYPPFYAGYVGRVNEHPIDAMRAQGEATHAFFAGLDESTGNHRYAPGKWTVRDIVAHLADTERIIGYRALCIARGDATPLPGFDQQQYAASAGAERQTVRALADALRVVRQSSLALFESLDSAAWARRGVASGLPVTVRALAHIIPGHERHHIALLRERYALAAPISEATKR